MAKPEFMSKEPSELTEEELILVRDFQKKEEAFLEERERLKKSLEAELHKLQAGIVQSMEQFDERVLKLFHLKIRTEMAIHQEELKVLRLSRALLIEEEISIRVRQLNQLLENKKVEKVTHIIACVHCTEILYVVLHIETISLNRSCPRVIARSLNRCLLENPGKNRRLGFYLRKYG